MKYLVILSMVFSSLLTISCKKEVPEYPKEVNIEYQVHTTRNTSAVITHIIDNISIVDSVTSLPFNLISSQVEVEKNTIISLNFVEIGVYSYEPSDSSWADYITDLSIRVNGDIVKSKSFNIIEGSGSVSIDYTFY